MPLILDGVTYYTTKEAAEKLGIQHATLRGAVARRRIAVRRLPEMRRNLIAEDELERYRHEVAGTKGWTARKRPGYTPDERRRAYQQRWRERHRTTDHERVERPEE
jgi:excisionase family DNA binding protein